MWNQPGMDSSRRRIAWIGAYLLMLVLGACATQNQATGPFPRFSQFEGDEVVHVGFAGDLRLSRDSLESVIRTRESRCRLFFLPICIPIVDWGREIYPLDLGELARDVVRLQLYYRDHGYYGAQIEPDVEPMGPDRVGVDFVIAPGRQVLLRSLEIEGVDTILETPELRDALPLQVGEPFGRLDFLASADTIRQRLLQRGHAYSDILRNYALDTIAGIAEVDYVALPGPVVFVDTILFEGNERLSDQTLRRRMTFREGDLLRVADLARSQRNLYDLGMVSFAAVRLAGDTVPEAGGEVTDQATVLVQLVEAAQFAVELSAGFGTVDCVRSGGRWVNRNFLGGGRRLEVVGSLSRIGIGEPMDLGLERIGCRALGEEAFFGLGSEDVKDRLDYRLSADFQQPSIFGVQNQLLVNLHTERLSETQAFIRESTGGRISASRQFERTATIGTTTLEIEYGRTLASPAVLCVGFDTCEQEDLDRLRQNRWSNSLSWSAVHDAQRTDGILNRGYLLRGGVDWASALLGSDDSYLRVLAEGSYYHPVSRGSVLAANLRLGRFLYGILGPEHGYIPPERRFYAGGPSSVRGYTRNALGPTAYVIPPGEDDPSRAVGSATGGTQLLVGSLELRMPSPWLRQSMRLAAFVDAGHVSAPHADLVSGGGLRFTPGAGVRFITPVGPFRLDVAYNPYNREVGPLYRVDPEIGLILDQSSFRPERPSFLGRFRFQFALGQAF